ncbi:MAG: sodium-dependent bicarbonate transport family permease [Rhodoferax sp.]|uniref:sodium-dependent bicarbonate transport family permease n=1 Tax=Rhodoferax sp. TaxID=50421 RepID=UPI0017E06993|nr:sodium-dependent bicarbonate transport family permease [Rhodoferax sp.]NMM18341.1 sodium-dependent bicarbonate transport family permease [Rhodoferax sp.]
MQNLLDPAILFFIFGVTAGALKSNLEIPPAIAKFLSLYLLMALGLKGGFALAKSGMDTSIAISLAAAIAMAFIVSALGYAFLKTRVAKFDAAAVAASYGSVSAVTFVTATQVLEASGLTFGGHMTAAMVLMESPAIIMAVLLANSIRHEQTATSGGSSINMSLGKILHESFTDGAQLLLLGSMVIGFISGEAGKTMMQPFAGDLFKGLLSFFLLDMGLMVARNFSEAKKTSAVLIVYASIGPLVHAAIALTIAVLLKMPVADAAMLMVLSASASYIVVPAVLRYAIPEANPSLYFGLSLGVTFPLNILFGIPLYIYAARAVLG